MEITIKDKTVTLKQTFRSHIIYEQITGETFKPQGVTQILTFFYSTVMASEPDMTIDFNDFISWIDETPTALTDFVAFLTENDKKQTALQGEPSEAKTPNKKTQPTKKKKSQS